MPMTPQEMARQIHQSNSAYSTKEDMPEDIQAQAKKIRQGFRPSLTEVPRQPAPVSMLPATMGGPAGALTPAMPAPAPPGSRFELRAGPSPPGMQLASGMAMGLSDLFSLGLAAAELVGRGAMHEAFPPKISKTGEVSYPLQDQEYISTKVARGARDMLENMGVPEPREGWERYERALGEEFLTAELPAGLLIRHAKKLQKAGKAPERFRRLVTHAGKYPGLFVTEEAVGAAGTALGRISVPEDSPIGQMIMGTLGGVSAGLGFQTLSTIGRGSRFLIDLTRSNIPEQRVIGRAAQRVQDSTGKEGKELALHALNRYQREGLPVEVRPTLGAVTGDYGIQTLEADLAVRFPDFNLRLRAAQEGGNQALVKDLIERGRYYGDPVDEARAAANAYLEAAKDSIQKRIKETMPDADREALSIAMRDELERIHDAIHEPLNNRYNELFAIMDSLGEEFSTQPLKDAVRRLREFEGFSPAAPGREEAIQIVSGEAPERLIRQIEDLPDTAPASIIHSFRRLLRDAVRDSTPEQRRYRKLLGILLDGVEEGMDDIKQIGLSRRRSPELRELTEELDVLDTEFREYARVFRETSKEGRTTSAKVLSKHGAAASAMLNEYARPGPGSLERLNNYKEAFKDSPVAMEAMEDYLVALAYDASRDQLGNPTRTLASFKRQYRVQLRAFPKAAERVRALESLGDEAKKLGIYGPKAESAIREGAVALFIDNPQKAVRYIGELPSEVAQRQAMSQLVKKTAGNDQARNGLRQLLWNQLTDKAIIKDRETKALMLSGANIRKFLEKHKGAFEALYSREELIQLEEIARTSDMMSQIRVAGVQRTQKAQEQAMEFLQRSGWFRPIWSGKMKTLRTVRAAHMLSMELTEAQSSNVLLEALINPKSQLANTLLSEQSPNTRRFLVNWMSKNIPTLAPRLKVQGEENRTALPGG